MAIIVNPTAAEFKQMLAEKKTFLADFMRPGAVPARCSVTCWRILLKRWASA